MLKIIVYTDQCYKCNTKKFDHIHKYILTNGLPLSTLETRRMELDRGWVQFVRKSGLKPPIVEITNGTDNIVARVEDFDEVIKKFDETKGESKGGK